MVPKESRKAILDQVLGATRTGLTIRLAKANPVPDDEDVTLGDLTECDFVGYAAQTPAWSAPTLDGDDVANSETGVLEFTAGILLGPQTIYAVYATRLSAVDGSTNVLICFDRLTATVTLSNPGEKFRRVCNMGDTDYAP